jgi:hypothetical protein
MGRWMRWTGHLYWRLLLVGLVAINVSARAADPKHVQIWLAGVDPLSRRVRDWQPGDFMDLFGPNALWSTAAAKINVFQVSTQFVLRSEDLELTRTIDWLKRRHIALAMAGLMLSGHDECGRGVEGYSMPNSVQRALTRIKKFGGELSYLVMDEPLHFGHVFAGANACEDSLAELAQEVSRKISDARSIFPNILIGDVEPVGGESDLWADDLLRWFNIFQQYVGTRPAFFRADIGWRRPNWQAQLMAVHSVMGAAHIKFGIIYNSNTLAGSRAWTEEAEAHFRLIESVLHIVPDQAVIQTWTRLPELFIPETDPATLTGLVDVYLRWCEHGHHP